MSAQFAPYSMVASGKITFVALLMQQPFLFVVPAVCSACYLHAVNGTTGCCSYYRAWQEAVV